MSEKQSKKIVVPKEKFLTLQKSRETVKEKIYREYIDLLYALNEREKLLRRIGDTIRSTLDLEKVLQSICEEVVKAFKVDRAFVARFP